MPEPHLRAADADRAAVAAQLGEHMSAGRLTVAEYDERLARAYAARTYGELQELTADLPPTPRPAGAGTSPTPGTDAAPRDPSPTPAQGPGPWAWGGPCAWNGVHSSWRAWLSTAVIVLAVWAVTSVATGGFVYFWPIWVIGPWGAVLLAQALTRGRDDRPDRRLHP